MKSTGAQSMHTLKIFHSFIYICLMAVDNYHHALHLCSFGILMHPNHSNALTYITRTRTQCDNTFMRSNFKNGYIERYVHQTCICSSNQNFENCWLYVRHCDRKQYCVALLIAMRKFTSKSNMKCVQVY